MTDPSALTVGDAVQHLQWPQGTVCTIVAIREYPPGIGLVAELNKLPFIPLAYDGSPLGEVEIKLNKLWKLDGLVRFYPDLPDPLERLQSELTALREEVERLRHDRTALIGYARETYEYWDADDDPKVGKRLKAMSGWLQGYDAQISDVHARAAPKVDQ